MREVVVVGQPNAGKTLFLLNFAAYTGVSVADLALRADDGTTAARSLPLSVARRNLVDAARHKTQVVQSMELRFPSGKTARLARVSDTPGLADTISTDAALRKAMAAALEALRRADVVLHMIDAAFVGRNGEAAIAAVDREVADYGFARGPYALLANKQDLPLARSGTQLLRRVFPGRRIIPVSALQRRGFREVKLFVWRHL